MYKAFLDTLQQAGITLPTWLFILALIILAIIGFCKLFSQYIIPIFKKIFKVKSNISSIDNMHVRIDRLEEKLDKSIAKSIECDAEIINKMNTISTAIEIMQKKSDDSEMVKHQDRILQLYRYYKSKGSWNQMESDCFWNVYNDYVSRGGNDFVHKTVEPYMRELQIIND